MIKKLKIVLTKIGGLCIMKPSKRTKEIKNLSKGGTVQSTS